MAYFIRKEKHDGEKTALGLCLFVELWMNVLQSKTPMLLGPTPFSSLSFLESIRHTLNDGQLEFGTIKKQIRTALNITQQLAWIRTEYPNWEILKDTLTIMLTKLELNDNKRDDAIVQLDELLDFFSRTRVSSHLDFILQVDQNKLSLIKDELTDFISDLIALGHSESFLYSWGLGVLCSNSNCSLLDRLQRFRQLGQKKDFDVFFKMRPNRVWVPNTDTIFTGRGDALRNYTDLPPWEYNKGEGGVLVNVVAPDYKAAIELAVDMYNQHIANLIFSSRKKKIILLTDEFRILNRTDEDELHILADDVKPYEPPLLTQGSAAWKFKKTSPEIASVLEQTSRWLASSYKLNGESRFITLWLALVSLFNSDDLKFIVPKLARYRLLLYPQVLAYWIVDYLGKAFDLGWTALSSEIIDRLKLEGRIEERIAPLVQTVRMDFSLLDPLVTQSPLLKLRLSELVNLCSKSQRSMIVSTVEENLQTLLPWVQSIRHSVAHFGSSSTTSLELANQHLSEDISLVYDQVATSALRERPEPISINDIHIDTMKEFDTTMESVLEEPCVSILHVRQGLSHKIPYRRERSSTTVKPPKIGPPFKL